MNKKVDEEFKNIHDEYLLQCICTELKGRINKAIDRLNYYNIGEALYYVPIQEIIETLRGE